MRLNNVDVEAVKKLVEEISSGKANPRVTKAVEGEWIFRDGEPQFRIYAKYEKGETTLIADSPSKMGGSGLAPDPVQYCLSGLIACFAQTYVGIAVEKGVKLTKLRIRAESRINLRRPLGIGDDPISEGVTIKVEAEGAPREVLQEILEEAMYRCPGVYCVSNPVPVKGELT